MRQGNVTFNGRLTAKLIRGQVKAPLSWHIRNRLTWVYIWGWLANRSARMFSAITGIPCLIGELRLVHIKANGQRVDHGIVAYRVVTTAFVNFMVDQLQTETSQWGDFKYHDSGVGTTDPVIGDTDIETTDGEARATGTQTEGASANIYRSVGTINYTTTKAITEHGLFSQSTGTTLMDRSEFAAVNVVNGDAIEFTYELTCTAGG